MWLCTCSAAVSLPLQFRIKSKSKAVQDVISAKSVDCNKAIHHTIRESRSFHYRGLEVFIFVV